MKYRVVVEGRPYEIEIGEGGAVWVDGFRRDVDLSIASGQSFHSLLLDGRSYETQVRSSDAERTEVVVNGRTYQTRLIAGPGIEEDDDAARAGDQSRGPASETWVKAPLPGLLVEARVSNGDHVNEGDVVVVLESMKMHLELRAPRAGVVSALETQAGQEVDLDQVLAIIA